MEGTLAFGQAPFRLSSMTQGKVFSNSLWNRESAFHNNDLKSGLLHDALVFPTHVSVQNGKGSLLVDDAPKFLTRSTHDLSSSATLFADDNMSEASHRNSVSSTAIANSVADRQIQVLQRELTISNKLVSQSLLRASNLIRGVIDCAQKCRDLQAREVQLDEDISSSSVVSTVLTCLDKIVSTYVDDSNVASKLVGNGIQHWGKAIDDESTALLAKLTLEQNTCKRLQEENGALKEELESVKRTASSEAEEKGFLSEVLRKVTDLAREEHTTLLSQIVEKEKETDDSRQWTIVLKETIVAMSKQIVDLNQKLQELEKDKTQLSGEGDILRTRLASLESRNTSLLLHAEDLSKWNMLRFL